MKLEEIKSGAVVRGIDPAEPVRIVSVDAAGEQFIMLNAMKALFRQRRLRMRFMRLLMLC